MKTSIRGLAIATMAVCLALASCGPTATEQQAPASVAMEATEAKPAAIGECVETTITLTGPRLEGAPDSGSSVEYANGMGQVSYDIVPGITTSSVGDAVRLCLVSIPENCPPGDDRGRVYAGTNLRTDETWTAPDSQHMCGGA